MASLPIGRSLEPFDPQTEDFEAYAERLEQYLLVNDVSDKKKQVAFFPNCGGVFYLSGFKGPPGS